MINDFIGTIVDRFNNINGMHVSIRYIDNYIYIGVVNNVETSIISRVYFCVYFYDKSLLVYIYPLDSDTSLSMFINYDEFTDVDEFAGMILCKVFYG